MDVKRLRRRHTLLESAGFLALPAVYVGLMAAGVLINEPSLALLTLGLVFMLVIQQRSTSVAMSVVPKRGKKGRTLWPAAELEAADSRFLRQAAFTAGTNLAAYLVFLLAIDRHLRAQAVGADPGFVVFAGAAAAIAVALFGKEAARRAAWKGFAAASPGMWASKDGVDGGRATRSPAAYLGWRDGTGASD